MDYKKDCGRKIIIKLFSYISSVCFLLAYILQLWRTYRTKDVEGVDIRIWYLFAIALLTGYLYGLLSMNWYLILNFGLSFACVLSFINMYYIYRDPAKEQTKKIIRDILKEFDK